MKKAFTSLAFALIVSFSAAPLVSAIDITPSNCAAVDKKDCAVINDNKLDSSKGQPSALKNGLNAAFMVLGMISVLMIVVGGFKFTASNGDPSIISSAKNTILFAVIGLIVAGLAFAIVNTAIDFL